jgi:hypothetical protein
MRDFIGFMRRAHRERSCPWVGAGIASDIGGEFFLQYMRSASVVPVRSSVLPSRAASSFGGTQVAQIATQIATQLTATARDGAVAVAGFRMNFRDYKGMLGIGHYAGDRISRPLP